MTIVRRLTQFYVKYLPKTYIQFLLPGRRHACGVEVLYFFKKSKCFFVQAKTKTLILKSKNHTFYFALILIHTCDSFSRLNIVKKKKKKKGNCCHASYALTMSVL